MGRRGSWPGFAVPALPADGELVAVLAFSPRRDCLVLAERVVRCDGLDTSEFRGFGELTTTGGRLPLGVLAAEFCCADTTSMQATLKAKSELVASAS